MENNVAMEKVKGKEKETVKKLDKVSLKGRVFIDAVENYRLKREVATAIIEVGHPFDSFEEPVRLTIKDNSRRGKFDYLSRKEITEKNITEFEITGAAYLTSFDDKIKRKKGEYVAIEIQDPFSDGVLYAQIKDEAVRGAFTMIAKEHLNLLNQNEIKKIKKE